MFWIEKLFQLLEPLVGTEKLFFPILNLVQSCADHVIAHGHDRPVEVCSLHTAFRRCVQYPHLREPLSNPASKKIQQSVAASLGRPKLSRRGRLLFSL